MSTITGNSRGTGSTSSSGSKSRSMTEDKNKPHREHHPDRYGKMAMNPDVQQDIKEVMAGMRDTPFNKILDANNTYFIKLRVHTSFSQGVCPQYATGVCTFPECRVAHLLRRETLTQHAQWLSKQIEPGCTRIKSGEEIQPQKRFRTSRENK